MKQEVVQDFLNLPGIAGVALLDGRSRPFFYGLEQTLSLSQQEMFAQGIQQVMSTTPANVERFEFQFVRYQVHLYKLTQGLVLLILSGVEFETRHHAQIEQLKSELQQDFASAIATFGLLSGTITLSRQPDWKRSTEDAIDPADLVNALNQMSQLASRYLGTTISSNYWKATRPDQAMAKFEVDRTARIRLIGASTHINTKMQRQIQAWVAAFVDRCTKIIRDFPSLIQHNLDPPSYQLLFTLPAFTPDTRKDFL